MEWFNTLLQIAIPAIPFVAAFAFALFLTYGAVSFYYRPVTAIRWVIWLFAIETIVVIQPALPLGITLFLPDLLFLLIGLAGMLRIFSIKLHREHYVWLLFGVVLMLSFALGVIKFGTKAGVEFRAFFYFWAGVWYLMTFALTSEEVDKIFRTWMFASAVLVVDVLFRWVAQSFGMEIANYWNEGGGSLRVFNAIQTYFLVQAFLIGFYAYLNKTGEQWWRVLLLLLFICIVVLQHRTMWVVLVVSLAALVLGAGKIRSKAVSSFLVMAIVGSIVLLPVIASGKLDTVGQALSHSVEEVGDRKSTMAWRIDSWQVLISKWAHDGPLVNLIGYPFGSGFSRQSEVSHNTVSVSPHSQYVSILLRTGMIGIISMLFAYYLAIKTMRKTAPLNFSQLVDGKLLGALLIGQLAFFITYSIHYSQILPLGFSLAMLIQSRGLDNNLGSSGLASYRIVGS